MEVVVTAGAVRRAELQSDLHHQHLNFYRPDAVRVAQPTVSKQKDAVDGLSQPKLIWGLPQARIYVQARGGSCLLVPCHLN